MVTHNPISHGIAGYVSQNGLMATNQYINAAPVTEKINKHVYATGGTESTVLEQNNGRRYKVHTFYDTANLTSYSIGPCEWVMVGGGGGGGGVQDLGWGPGGAGGAGGARAALDDVGAVSTGLRQAPSLTSTVTVGYAGGAGNWSAQGQVGGTSSALGVSTSGGGGGGVAGNQGAGSGSGGGNGGAAFYHQGTAGGSNSGGYNPSEAAGGISPRTSTSHRITGSLSYYPGSYGTGGAGGNSSPGYAGSIGIVVIRYPIG